MHRMLEQGASKLAGRRPTVLILAPTRELAKQTSDEWKLTAPEFSTLSVYGGTAYDPQVAALRQGTDVIVGTPGRISGTFSTRWLAGPGLP